MNTRTVPEIVLLELDFRVLLRITGLKYYHGAQWNALFRNALKHVLPTGLSMAKAGIGVIPRDTGIPFHDKEDHVRVGLVFPFQYAGPVISMLRTFNNLPPGRGAFRPGRTILLENLTCRVSKTAVSPEKADVAVFQPFNNAVLAPEAAALQKCMAFTISFYSPLRLKRPGKSHASGHRYVDAAFYREHGGKALVCALINGVRPSGQRIEKTGLEVGFAELFWIDSKYGKYSTPMGGVAGIIGVTGRLTEEEAWWLTLGQYVGAGKNTAFGLGYYHIPELDSARLCLAPSRGTGLFEKAISLPVLERALFRLSNASPGPDGLLKDDICKAGTVVLQNLAGSVMDGTYRHGPVKTFLYPKSSGGTRTIIAANMLDRVLHRAIGDILGPASETILSSAPFAYRKGLNRQAAAATFQSALKDGYTTGIKADVAAFFGSVDIGRLCRVLAAYFPADPLPGFICGMLETLSGMGVSGLPQGSPLSPVLSNLYLHYFDRMMETSGFKMIRYGDDFVLLCRPEAVKDAGEAAQKGLALVGLSLNPEKCISIPGKDGNIPFLGYEVSGSEITQAPADPDPSFPKAGWLPVFEEHLISGRPVYLTCLCRHVCSRGADLVVTRDDGGTETVPWPSISRIVIVGRADITGGVVYRAMRENIPTTFIDIMGITRGNLLPGSPEMKDHGQALEKAAADPLFRLALMREVISCKIRNSSVILRRNRVDPAGMKALADKVGAAETLAEIMGYEGMAARIYFSKLSALVEPFTFDKRVFHPSPDPVNAMLSFGYTLLYNRLSSALMQNGLNPRTGIFHQGRGRHNALASDLMEDIRHIIDRVVLSLIHKREITEKDFTVSKRKDFECARLSGEGFRKFIHRYEKTLEKKFQSPDDETMSGNAYLDNIAARLIRAVRLGVPYTGLRIR